MAGFGPPRSFCSTIVMKSACLSGLLLLLAIGAAAANDLQTAVAAFERGEYASAEVILHEILSKQPDDASALGLLGAVLDSEKKEQRSRSRLWPCSASCTSLGKPPQQLWKSPTRRWKCRRRKASYLKAVALDPSRANANFQLASIEVEQKHGKEALRYLSHLPAEERSSAQVQLVEMRALF